MFEATIEKDLKSATCEAEREAFVSKIYNKYRCDFLAFIEELKKSGIAQALYNSSTPEETISIWEKYSSEKQELFARIKYWAEGRSEYFDTYEPLPLFEEDEEIECILEIGLMILIVRDECILLGEDINEAFDTELVAFLKKSSNEIIRAAGCYIDCNGYDTITSENIFDFCLADE